MNSTLKLAIDDAYPEVASVVGDNKTDLLLGKHARRIVNCVNAFEGISDEALEAYGPFLERAVWRQHKDLKALTMQLVETLDRFVEQDLTVVGSCLHIEFPDHHEAFKVVTAARALLAKAKVLT